MIRIKSSSAKKHKKLFKTIKKIGHSYKKTNQKILKSLKYIYFMRKKNSNFYRKFWITQINNYSKKIFLNYNNLFYLIKKKNILLNRKILSQEIIFNPLAYFTFSFILLFKK